MSRPLFLASPEELATAAPGRRFRLDGEEGRHAARVRRLRLDEELDVADGQGRRVHARVAGVDPAALDLEVLTVIDEPADPVRLVLVQALAKGGRDEQAVETATEVGVDAVVPWQAARCVSVWAGKAERGRARWQAIAREAAKQSRRAWQPEVREVVLGDRLADLAAEVTAAGGAVLVLHESAEVPIAQAVLPGSSTADAWALDPSVLELAMLDPVMPIDADAAPEVLVVVGPEGGIADAELAALDDAGGQVVRLGPHVMRSSTAGPVAIALLAQRLGRWTAGGS